MATLLDVVRGGVKIANTVTRSLQPLVKYERSRGLNEYGEIDYASPVYLHAIVDYTARTVRTQGGVMTVTRATIDLLDVNEIVLATGGQGISNEDRFTFPDGDTGPTLDIGGFIDAGTGHPVATTVMIG